MSINAVSLVGRFVSSQAEQGSPEPAALASLIMNGISASAAATSSRTRLGESRISGRFGLNAEQTQRVDDDYQRRAGVGGNGQP